MLLLVSNQVVTTQLDDIKWFVEVLIGITIGLILATGFATWKVSDIEVKNIRKYLEDNIEDNYNKLNNRITATVSEFKPISMNGWIVANGDMKKTKIANITIITLDVTLINNSELLTPDRFMSDHYSYNYDLSGKYPCFVLDGSKWITVRNDNGNWFFEIDNTIRAKSIRIQHTWIKTDKE